MIIKVTIGNNLSRKAVTIDNATTLREALENAEIDYSIGMTNLDGATLAAGDLDKSFEDFGITKSCYLLNVVKADNAAEITIVGGAVVIGAKHSLDEIKRLKKHRPDALKLFEGEGNKKEEIFMVDVAKSGNGSISMYGACFGTNTNAEGMATITTPLPNNCEDPVAFVKEEIGTAIIKLNKVEAKFDEALNEVEAEEQAILDSVTVL